MLLPSVSNQKLDSQLFSLHIKAPYLFEIEYNFDPAKVGVISLGPSALLKTLHVCVCGGFSFPHLEVNFSEKKNTIVVTLDVIAERKE